MLLLYKLINVGIMLKKIKYLFSYYSFYKLENKALDEDFYTYRQKSAYKQITYISLVTAFIYILMSIVNHFVAPQELLPTISNMQLYIITPYILIVSYLGYKKKPFAYLELMLFTAPIFAAAIHIYLMSKLDSYNTHQTELYLMIFWIYTISGMSFTHSIITSLIVFFMGTTSSYLLYPNQMDSFIIYSSWMSISLIFGFVGGYLLQDSHKNTFLKEMELKKLATLDALTGLYNRVKLDEVLNLELHRASRYKHTFGIMMIDIDFFKSINDNYGHLVGDAVLVKLSKSIRQNIRSSDTMFRWGGEEFVILSLEVDETTLLSLAENIRKTVEDMQIQEVGQVTVSIGVTLHNPNDNVNTIMKRADDALYNAKNNNRNCVKFL